MLFWDPTMLVLIPGIIIAAWAQFKVQAAFSKYSRMRATKGYTGAQVARFILDDHGLNNVSVQSVRGHLSDHYDPRSKVLRLSDDVYGSSSIAAVSVAAHEVGHAIQDAEAYGPLRWRSSLVPVANFGNYASWIILIIGVFMGSFDIAKWGIILFGVVVLFQLVTLPVEFNASSRAVAALAEGSFLESDEIGGAKKVLNAAALTYVAALITAILTMARFILLALGSRRD